MRAIVETVLTRARLVVPLAALVAAALVEAAGRRWG